MRTIYTPSTISEEAEDKLWQNALIVFDTCALLDFYFLTEEYQIIMSDIVDLLQDRIWIPSQVKYEFDKNHKGASIKPKLERYSDNDIQNNNLVRDLKQLISQWEKKYYHPFISDKALATIQQDLAEIEPKIAEIKTTLAFEYQARKKEIEELQKKDIISKSVAGLTIGEPFNFSEIKHIAAEGRVRFANQIPPGYKDAETKSGIRQYGDLIIWKEILRKAKESNVDIIFVSNDQKSDWVILDETAKDKKAEKPNSQEVGKPRRELLAEFEEETKHNIWFYSTASFITKLEEVYKPKQEQLAFYGKLGIVRDVLEQIERERLLRQHLTGDTLLVRCDNCNELFDIDAGDFFFEWEGGQVDDRGMGPEYEYVSGESCECPNCHCQVDIQFHVWEYPQGSFNTQNIEADGGSIEKTIDLSKYIHFDNYDTCYRCGEHAVLNEIGLCENCQEEFDRFVNSDD